LRWETDRPVSAPSSGRLGGDRLGKIKTVNPKNINVPRCYPRNLPEAQEVRSSAS